ncbi:collagen binding domain-containing protein [Levilactobacillus brevis]|uniref:collagen binding domain-containing protein n=1 Tax=Levilactobacillus brevis TaxID=1580 RepID=UPI0021A8D134|nr:collagen binding domain-containing protein [Levilactobacillus brevis]MCT3575021.1 LPXTG cell wall anchor domain-containing protein [Levilactobacillus brevis]
MKKNHQGWRILVRLFAMLGFLVISQWATSARAATNYQGADFTTAAKVTNGPDFKHADTIDVQYKLDFGSTSLHNGDTISLDFPENLRGKTPGDTFDVTDESGVVIGKAVVSDTGVVITMNDALEGKTNAKLTLNLATKYRYDDTGEKDVVFPLENNGSSTSTINMVANEANLSKNGVIQDDGTIKWSILVNRKNLNLKNVEISDTIGDHQEMIQGVTVSKAYWTSATGYKREKPAMSEDEYKVTYHDQGFDLAFNDPLDQVVVIDYYTKITDPSLIDTGYKFRNSAEMTWGGGTSGTKHSEKANGRVSSSNGNSGSGSGDTNETTEEPEDKDTGTIDTDNGTETDAEEEAREEAESKEEAAKEAEKEAAAATAKKRAAAKAKQTAAKAKQVATTKSATAKPTATQSAGQTVNHNRKLPQTDEAPVAWVTLGGLGLLLAVGSVRVLRRH